MENATLNSAADELAVFVTSAEVELKGKKYEITPMAWTTELRLLKEVSPLIVGVMGVAGRENFTLPDVFKALLEHDIEKSIEIITKAIKLTIDVPEEIIMSLDIGELEQLISSVIEVNKAFFTNAYSRFMERNKEAVDQVKKQKK